MSDVNPRKNVMRLSVAIRAHSLRMVHLANASHIGSCLSVADILAVLYARVLRVDSANPDWPERDRMILSKGHAAAAMYAALAETGFFPVEWLETYCRDGSKLMGHISHCVPGIELSTGSLGHGLPVGCGMALAGKRDGMGFRVFALISDGELDEGSNWEAALFASHHRLDNLVVIVDRNNLQGFGRVEDVMSLEPLAAKWEAFGWAVKEIDGHDHEAIEQALASTPFMPDKPSIIVAKTIKGKGVSFMEDQLAWHYKSPGSDQLVQALSEVEGKI